MKFLSRALFVLLVFCSASVMQGQNVIQLENMKPGTDRWMLTAAAHNREIEGYASATSVNRGEQIKFYVNTAESSYKMDIYRLGWYDGKGGRHMAGPISRTGTKQIVPAPNPTTGLIECNWTDPYVLSIPNSSDATDWASGVYLVKLTSGTSLKNSYIIFVVRDDARTATHYFQSSVTTYQAYNAWGGKSLYANFSTNGVPAQKVSFNRPYAEGDGTGSFLWRWEYNMLRFMEREGYDVSYCTNVDTHRRGSLIRNHNNFMSVGHDEYWSAAMRDAVTGARDAGVNLSFFSANNCYWQIRFEPSTYDASQQDRTIVSYKEQYTQDPYYKDSDRANDKFVTSMWRSAPVNNSEDALLGVMYVADPVDSDIVIDDVTSAPWVFADTGLVSGSELPGLLGYEVDRIGPRTPSNTIRLGHSWYTTNDPTDPTPSSGYSNMTLYTAASGAYVFSTGSIQWSWGLDDWNSDEDRPSRVHAGAQQMTRNILKKFAGPNWQRDCQFLLDATSVDAPSPAGSRTINVTSQCNWSVVTSSATWVTIQNQSGSGSGAVTFQWLANPGPARTATITIGDRKVTVQQASGCVTTLSPTSATVDAAASSGSFSVSTSNPACTWSAVSNVSWISITGGATGSSSGSVSYSVQANSGSSRSGSINVNNRSYAISQGNGCTYTVAPTQFDFDAAGGSTSVTMTTDGSCYWSSSTGQPWITITSAGEGRGSATVTFAVAPNQTASSRSSYLVVAGKAIIVKQTATTSCTALAISAQPQSKTSPAPGAAVSLSVTATGSAPAYQWYIGSAGTAANPIAGATSSSLQVSPTATTSYWVRISNACGQVNSVTATVTVPVVRSTFVRGDFDGDRRSDPAVFRPSTGVWYLSGRSVSWGAAGDVPVRGDFDGDGKADLASYRPSSGLWQISQSSNGTTRSASWGSAGDVPAPADYDGDGKTDIAIFRASSGVWSIILSANGATRVIQWGGSGGDIPVPADYDGDGKADIAIFSQGSGGGGGLWYIITSSNGGTRVVQWGGTGGDIPVPSDFDGDGRADIAIESPVDGRWYIITSANNGTRVAQWGGSGGDQPQPADFDGDGKADLAIFNPGAGQWYIVNSATGSTTVVSLGQQGDIAVTR